MKRTAPRPDRPFLPVPLMAIDSALQHFPPHRVQAVLADLPTDSGYRLEVKPLRYRTRPHLQALCDWTNKVITVQVPEPFRPFRERVPYRAQRVRSRAGYANEFAFQWFYRDIVFRTRTEVIRFLYCHEYYHYYLHDVLGRKGAAETACDRFALEHFRQRKR
ncbi:MAG TPA: hypothetical protein VMU36_03950 [Spirochaetia bacterium]|nr:hypothetical protein [Spirochaetia bacterium]